MAAAAAPTSAAAAVPERPRPAGVVPRPKRPRVLARLLASAQRRGLLLPLAVCVPLASMLSMLATVWICLSSWRDSPDSPSYLLFPAISELGIDEPRRRKYQVGFALCGVLLSFGIVMFEELVVPELLLLQGRPPELVAVAEKAAWWGHASAIGVALQGIFTLERQISVRCFVHWAGAILFIVGAMRHAKASNDLYEAAARGGAPLLRAMHVESAVRLRRFLLDYSSFVAFLIPLLMQALPRSDTAVTVDAAAGADEGASQPDPRMMNAMGLAQWAIVLQFATYFCTYVADLRAAAVARVGRAGAGAGSGLGHPLRAAAAAAVAVPRAAGAAAATAGAAAAAASAIIKAPAFC